MSEQESLFSRMGRWFKRRFTSQEDLPLLHGQTETPKEVTSRPLLGFPWQQKTQDLTHLQAGLTSMTALMTSLRQYLDQQSARHDELLTYLSQLSHALQAIPDSSRVQSEMLRVLHQQIAYQNAQHKQLSEMIRKMAESSGMQHETIDLLRDRVETLYKNDEQISSTIEQVGASMTVVTQNSQTNTLVLERLRDNLVTRDGELDRSINRWNRWVLVTLLTAIAVSFLTAIFVVVVSIYNISAISRVGAEVSQMQKIPAVTVPAQALDPSPATLPVEAGRPATQPAATQAVPATQSASEHP